MSDPAIVGGDVDAFCTRCKLKLGHTVLAMVGTRIARVRCNTCQGEHNYKSAAPKPTRRRESATPKPRATDRDLDDLLEGKDTSRARRYVPSELFERGEVVDHAAFGLGVVVEVRGDRFDVVFRAGPKTLAQRKAHVALPKRHVEHARGVESPEDLGPAGAIEADDAVSS